jgi:O-antigen/teichoic acid export membrane protein
VTELARTVARGFAWFAFQTVGARVINLLGQVALALILAPEDFGRIGLAYTITTFGALLVNPGIEEVLVQRHGRLQRWITPGFWLGASLGVGGGLVMLVAAPLAASLYQSPELFGMIAILALAAPLGGVALAPNAMLRASLQFRTLAQLGLAEMVATQCLTVLLALCGWGAYSFVLPAPLTVGARSLAVWLIARPRVRWKPQIRRWRFLLGNGFAVFANRLITVAMAQAGNAILGLWASEATVGAYYFAFNLASQSLRMMANSLIGVLFPVLSRLTQDVARQGEAAMKATRVLTAIVMPLCFLQAALVAPLLHLVFGAKWDNAVLLAQILSLGLAFDSPAWVAGSLLHAKGQFRQSLAYHSILAPVFLSCIFVGAWRWSATGVAAATAFYSVFFGPLYVCLVFRKYRITWSRIIGLYTVPAGSSIIAVGAAYALSLLLPEKSPVWQIATILIAGCALYLPLSYAAMPDLWSDLWTLLRGRRRGRPPAELRKPRLPSAQKG